MVAKSLWQIFLNPFNQILVAILVVRYGVWFVMEDAGYWE